MRCTSRGKEPSDPPKYCSQRCVGWFTLELRAYTAVLTKLECRVRARGDFRSIPWMSTTGDPEPLGVPESSAADPNRSSSRISSSIWSRKILTSRSASESCRIRAWSPPASVRAFAMSWRPPNTYLGHVGGRGRRSIIAPTRANKIDDIRHVFIREPPGKAGHSKLRRCVGRARRLRAV